MRTKDELEQLKVNEEYIRAIRKKGEQHRVMKSKYWSEEQKSFFLTGFMAGYIEREKEIRNQNT